MTAREIYAAAASQEQGVALDENFRPRSVPPLVLETDEERRRNRQAEDRRQVRLTEKTHERSCRTDPDACHSPRE